MNRCSETHSPREVIENQLLVALDDKSKVAIVADWELLSYLIHASRECPPTGSYSRTFRQQVTNDLEQLAKAAFGRKP